MPREPDPKLQEYLMPYSAEVARMMFALRELVLKEAPDAGETVFRGYAVSIAFSFTGRWTEAFCHVVAYKAHVNLGFNRGAELPDPKGVLEGTGKLIRHIPVRTLADLKNPNLLRFLRKALKLVRQAF